MCLTWNGCQILKLCPSPTKATYACILVPFYKDMLRVLWLFLMGDHKWLKSSYGRPKRWHVRQKVTIKSLIKWTLFSNKGHTHTKEMGKEEKMLSFSFGGIPAVSSSWRSSSRRMRWGGKRSRSAAASCGSTSASSTSESGRGSWIRRHRAWTWSWRPDLQLKKMRQLLGPKRLRTSRGSY